MTQGKRKSYYGPVFWLSVVSFAVPVIVAVKAFDATSRPYSRPEPKPDGAGVDNALWDYLLKMYVRNGQVDYELFKRDHLFQSYIRQLGAAEPEKLPKDEDRLALLCNAYNAFVIDGVIKHDVKTTVEDVAVGITRRGFFDLKEHILAGQTISLNQLENEMIRKKFKEPRIHMALVCAARSCPDIRPEAFVGGRLEKQLEDQARLFVNNPEYVRYDPESKTLHLSAILKWYGDDFGGKKGVLAFLAKRTKDPKLTEAIEKASKGEVKMAFNKYDWALNSQKSAGTAGKSRRKTGFGSGAVPNE